MPQNYGVQACFVFSLNQLSKVHDAISFPCAKGSTEVQPETRLSSLVGFYGAF